MASQEKYLFVGGPWHGSLRTLEGDLWNYQVATRNSSADTMTAYRYNYGKWCRRLDSSTEPPYPPPELAHLMIGESVSADNDSVIREAIWIANREQVKQRILGIASELPAEAQRALARVMRDSDSWPLEVR